MPPGTPADENDELRETYDYKVVGDCRIKADVYGASRDVVWPVVIWIHGGALIMGHRGIIDRALAGRSPRPDTWSSIDYRLAPETKLPAILDDVPTPSAGSATGAGAFASRPDRIAVTGGSAGGYLTLTTGYRVEPRPKALVAFWGYGDVAGPWYSRPDPFYRSQPLVTKEEAEKVVGGRSSPRPRHRKALAVLSLLPAKRALAKARRRASTLIRIRRRLTHIAPSGTSTTATRPPS